MAYSTNPEIVVARLGLLTELQAGRACRWRVDPPTRRETHIQAYRIREALFCANVHADQFPALALAYHTFSIHEVEPGLVEAKLKTQAGVEVSAASVTREVPIHGLAPWGREVSTVSKTTAQELIDGWQAHLPSNDPLKFPQTKLPPEELRLLHSWASSNTPRLMLLVGAESITISLTTPDMAAFAWQPPPEPKKPEKQYDL